MPDATRPIVITNHTDNTHMHWRTHPQLAGKFHPEHHDDLQVLVHDGGPRLTTAQPEAVWVTVTAYEDNVFVGRVLNKPLQLRTVAQGDQIRFLVPANSELPILVSPKYLSERPSWKITPCSQCGNDELFDAPSDLIKAIFPNLPPSATMTGSRVSVHSAVACKSWNHWTRKHKACKAHPSPKSGGNSGSSDSDNH